MSKPFHRLPHTPTIPLKDFAADIDDSVLEDLKRRIHETPEIRDTYETLANADKDGEDLGVKKGWINDAVSHWTGGFDWYVAMVCDRWIDAVSRRSIEKRINNFANYTAEIEHDDFSHTVHFMSRQHLLFQLILQDRFSKFLPLTEHLSREYTPETLRVNLIVPSLIGYGYSSGPPLDKELQRGIMPLSSTH